MPPPVLRFDLRPRRSRHGVRVLAVTVLAGASAPAALWLAARQSELDRLGSATAQAREAAGRFAPQTTASSRAAPWQAGAEQDSALFVLPADPRLLEIERCTDARTVVTRIVHEAVSSTSVELSVDQPQAVRGLLECLNQSVQDQPMWRLITVETQGAAGQHVVLRYR